MKIKWSYDLPTTEFSNDYHYESPILVKGNDLFFILTSPSPALHIIDVKTGCLREIIPCIGNSLIPSRCFFVDYKDTVIFYTGELWAYDGKKISRILDLSQEKEINSHILQGNRLLLCGRSRLFCLNLDTLSAEWELNIENSTQYRTGDISIFEETVACFGQDKLLFIDLDNGSIRGSIKIPRIAKLYCPIRAEDNTLLLGYTNWSNAGILKYDECARQVLWKSKRSFEGPQLKCKIYAFDNFVCWVKNGRELICHNSENGEEIYRTATSPWLYTDLFFNDGNIIFGTSGSDGYIFSINAQNGEENWSLFLKNGCAYYDMYNDSIIVGDFSKRIHLIDASSGRIIKTLATDGEVVGQIKVHGKYAYTVIWGNENAPIRLIKIQL